MKKEYLEPEMKIKRIDFSDILTSSVDPMEGEVPADGGSEGPDGGNGFW